MLSFPTPEQNNENNGRACLDMQWGVPLSPTIRINGVPNQGIKTQLFLHKKIQVNEWTIVNFTAEKNISTSTSPLEMSGH